MPHTIPASAPLVPATCLHAALFFPFSDLNVPECPPYMATPARLPSMPATPLVNLPLTPQESRACLAELRALDAGSLSQQLHLAVEGVARTVMPAHEAEALSGFAGKATTEVSPQARMRQAQTLLLMIWVQEERILDIAKLSQQCARSEKKLASLLGETSSDGEAACTGDSPSDRSGLVANPDADELKLLPAWPFVLQQLSFFLPEDAVLAVTHPDLATRLHESRRLEPYSEGLLGARFGLGELTRRSGASFIKESEYLFLLPHKVLA